MAEGRMADSRMAEAPVAVTRHLRMTALVDSLTSWPVGKGGSRHTRGPEAQRPR